MRILMAIDSYPPPLVGGRDLQVSMLAHELARRGHDVEVVALAGPSGARTDMDDGITVHRIPGWSRSLNRFYADPERPWHPPIPDPGLVRSLIGLVRRRRPHIVHAHSWILYSLLPFLPSSQTRLVVTMHDYGFLCPKNTFVHRDVVCSGPRFAKCIACATGQYGAVRASAITMGMAASHALLHRVDRYIAVSPPVARACVSLAAEGQRPLDVITPFISDESIQEVDSVRPAFVPSQGDYVMFAGALGPHKGVDVLLESFDGMVPKIPLVLVGLPHPDGNYRFPDGVMVVQNVPHEEVLRAWANCAVAVVPSRWPDPCPTVALEAMAAGRPVVASAVGGLPYMVLDEKTGILVPPGDVSALRKGIARLLTEPGLRVRMGQAGREHAAKYLASTVVPQVERVYQEVLASASPAHGGKSR